MKNINVDQLCELIKVYESYHEQHTTYDREQFSRWLVRQWETEEDDEQVSARTIVNLSHRMQHYSRLYIRAAFGDLSINTLEEYWFLDTIVQRGNPSKSEVYAANVTELTTGTQILKRLVNKGLVQEESDTEDRRVRRVVITDAGKALWEEAGERLDMAAQYFTSGMGVAEQKEFSKIGEFLDNYHSQRYSRVSADTLKAHQAAAGSHASNS